MVEFNAVSDQHIFDWGTVLWLQVLAQRTNFSFHLSAYFLLCFLLWPLRLLRLFILLVERVAMATPNRGRTRCVRSWEISQDGSRFYWLQALMWTEFQITVVPDLVSFGFLISHYYSGLFCGLIFCCSLPPQALFCFPPIKYSQTNTKTTVSVGGKLWARQYDTETILIRQYVNSSTPHLLCTFWTFSQHSSDNKYPISH